MTETITVCLTIVKNFTDIFNGLKIPRCEVI